MHFDPRMGQREGSKYWNEMTHGNYTMHWFLSFNQKGKQQKQMTKERIKLLSHGVALLLALLLLIDVIAPVSIALRIASARISDHRGSQTRKRRAKRM
jgi:hypothetical protein